MFAPFFPMLLSFQQKKSFQEAIPSTVWRGGDPTNTIRMLQEARSDGWLGGEIIGLIINNSQWIDDDTWISDQSRLGIRHGWIFFLEKSSKWKGRPHNILTDDCFQGAALFMSAAQSQSFWMKIAGLKKNR